MELVRRLTEPEHELTLEEAAKVIFIALLIGTYFIKSFLIIDFYPTTNRLCP